MGASNWGTFPPLALSFWTWVGGTGLWDCPVARYMAWTHKMRSCSSSLANITVSPSLTALKKARPPSKPGIQGINTSKLSCHVLSRTKPWRPFLLLFRGPEKGGAIYLTPRWEVWCPFGQSEALMLDRHSKTGSYLWLWLGTGVSNRLPTGWVDICL